MSLEKEQENYYVYERKGSKSDDCWRKKGIKGLGIWRKDRKIKDTPGGKKEKGEIS